MRRLKRHKISSESTSCVSQDPQLFYLTLRPPRLIRITRLSTDADIGDSISLGMRCQIVTSAGDTIPCGPLVPGNEENYTEIPICYFFKKHTLYV